MDLSVRFPKSPSRASARRYRVGGERITVVIVPIDRDQNSTLEKIEELKLVLSRDPGSHVYVELAQLYIQMEDLVSARGVVLDGLSRDQRHVPGQMKLAEVDFALGFYDRAEPTLRKILQARPKNSAATLLLVDLLISTERQSEAVTLLRHKIRLYSTRICCEITKLTGAKRVTDGARNRRRDADLRPGIERKARTRQTQLEHKYVAPTPVSGSSQPGQSPKQLRFSAADADQPAARSGGSPARARGSGRAEITERETSPSIPDTLFAESTQRAPGTKKTVSMWSRLSHQVR